VIAVPQQLTEEYGDPGQPVGGKLGAAKGILMLSTSRVRCASLAIGRARSQAIRQRSASWLAARLR
jgi:hypothetical protein